MGYNDANELANILANEPAAASEERFVSTEGGADTITFREDGSSSSSSGPSPSGGSSGGSSGSSDDELDADTAEFDQQIQQVEEDLKKSKEELKVSMECARKVQEQQAEIRSLQEQKEHLIKEKEKRILQAKLDKQMKDLEEINRMSRQLRDKFNQLKHTQKLIQTKMTGTKSSLSQLDADSGSGDDDLSDTADNLSEEMQAMHAAQAKILAATHDKNEKHVTSSIKTTNELHAKVQEELNKDDY